MGTSLGDAPGLHGVGVARGARLTCDLDVGLTAGPRNWGGVRPQLS